MKSHPTLRRSSASFIAVSSERLIAPLSLPIASHSSPGYWSLFARIQSLDRSLSIAFARFLPTTSHDFVCGISDGPSLRTPPVNETKTRKSTTPKPNVSISYSPSMSLLPTAATPNHALQPTAPGCHACCSPQSPPRSSPASPPPWLSLGSLGVATRHL